MGNNEKEIDPALKQELDALVKKESEAKLLIRVEFKFLEAFMLNKVPHAKVHLRIYDVGDRLISDRKILMELGASISIVGEGETK